MPTFVIKHQSGGSYIRPLDWQESHADDTSVVVHSEFDGSMLFEFDIVDGVWGYLRHVLSGKVVQPSGGQVDPDNDVGLVLDSDRNPGALFALDDVNHYIIHKGGKFAHPAGGSHSPCNNCHVVLHEHIHGAMKWLFVSPGNTSQDVSVYGKPIIGGEWRVINTVLNPVTRHTLNKKFKVGKAKIESRTSPVQFKWEVEAPREFLRLSPTLSFTAKVGDASSSTWADETNVSKEIRGESIHFLSTQN